jgi:chromosome segregation ATPase
MEPPPPRVRQTRWMPIALIVAIIAIVAVGYGQYSANSSLDERLAALEGQLQENMLKLQKSQTALTSDIEVLTKHVGVTEKELADSRAFAEKLRKDHENSQQQLASTLAKKADTEELSAARQEAATKLESFQKDSDTKYSSVSTDVKTVATNLETTQKDLAANKRDLIDVKTALSDQIARNSSELAALRQKGERDFFDIDMKKAKKNQMQRVGDIRLELRETDAKKQKYGIVIQVDDKMLEKKDKLINEPIQFLVGSNQLRYEIVINKVEKDHIVGYLSTPKNKALAAERPSLK